MSWLVTIEPIVADINRTNIEDFCKDSNLILDGSDNFEVRYLINDVALKHNKPWVYGGAVGSNGDLERLLNRKHRGMLKPGYHSFSKGVEPPKLKSKSTKEPVPPDLAHHVQASAPSPTPIPSAVNDVLDRLVTWKRLHVGTRDEN